MNWRVGFRVEIPLLPTPFSLALPYFRGLLCVFLCALGAMSTPYAAAALDYPTRPVHSLVGFLAGSTTDVVARLIARRLSERLGQSFVVEDRTGASGNIAADAAPHIRRTREGLINVPFGPD